MVAHVLLERDSLVAGDWVGELGHNFAPVGFASGDHLASARMRLLRNVKIMGVQRLIDDRAIVAIAPRPHHRGRDIPRTGPHRQTERLESGHVPKSNGTYGSKR